MRGGNCIIGGCAFVPCSNQERPPGGTRAEGAKTGAGVISALALTLTRRGAAWLPRPPTSSPPPARIPDRPSRIADRISRSARFAYLLSRQHLRLTAGSLAAPRAPEICAGVKIIASHAVILCRLLYECTTTTPPTYHVDCRSGSAYAGAAPAPRIPTPLPITQQH